MRFRLIVHRQTVLREEWDIDATDAKEARQSFLDGEGMFREEESIGEDGIPDIISITKLGVDPDIDVDEGL